MVMWRRAGSSSEGVLTRGSVWLKVTMFSLPMGLLGVSKQVHIHTGPL